ncbi:MAG TPA: hypothetical protein VL595_02735, partial [Pseudonocardia sp.]|nr:hypothetical protein [Pseudonocardia sp.]
MITLSRSWFIRGLHGSRDTPPCADAILDDSVLHIQDLRHDERWPTYSRLGTELGWASMLSYRLNSEVTGP